MSTKEGHANILRRIAINVGDGFVPGINTVVKGAAMAAANMGWELIGIRDGFEGLLHPEKYTDNGLVNLSRQLVENLNPSEGSILSQPVPIDPSDVHTINESKIVEEADRSDQVLNRLKEENIDGLISIVGNRGLNILYELHQKGLSTVCIPWSIDNDIASAGVSFGFSTALTITIETLERARIAAQTARKIVVVEVLGEQAGWIALQAGIAAFADVIMFPEISADLKAVAARLKEKITDRRPYAMVVVAQGAKFNNTPGQAAQTVAAELQLLLAEETSSLLIDPSVRSGHPGSVDRQLGIAYGAGALQALNSGKKGVMVAFNPPEIKYVPLAEVINNVNTVHDDSELLKIAYSLGIFCGEKC